MTKKYFGFIFVLGVISSSSFSVQAQLAETCTGPTQTCSEGQIPVPIGNPIKCSNGSSYKEMSCQQDCGKYKKELEDLLSDAIKTCSESGLTSNFSSCVRQLKKCTIPEPLENTSSSFLGSISSMVGQLVPGMSTVTNALNSTPKGRVKGGGTCSTRSEKDYFEREKELQSQLDQANDDLKELKEKLSEADKDFKDEKGELLEESAEVQAELSEQLLDSKNEQAQQQSELARNQSSTAEQIRQLNSQLMAKRSEMVSKEMEFTQKISGMTSKLGETACIAEAKKLRDELKAVFGADFYAQNKKSKALQEKFDNCLKLFQLQRIQLSNQRDSYLKLAQNDIRNIEEQLAEANQSLESMEKLNKEAIANLQTRQNEISQNAITRVQNAQTKLNDSATNLQQTQTNLSSEQNELLMRINTINNDLSNLGPIPEAGATKKWTDAQSAVALYYTKKSNLPESCQSTIKVKSLGVSDSDLEKAAKRTGKEEWSKKARSGTK